MKLRTGLAIALLTLGASAQAADDNAALNKVLNVKASAAVDDGVSEVRGNTIREMANTVGMRAGLIDASRKMRAQIQEDGDQLDRDGRFVFSTLILPNGTLPPVITEAKDVISVMDRSMTVANVSYRIVSEARFVGVAPTWRDYLYLGLSFDDDPLVGDAQRGAYPKNDKEEALWKRIVLEGYAKGQAQAKKIFELNMARLERDHTGMENFHALYERGLVSMPTVTNTTIAESKRDPNLMVIGQTTFRITQPAAFKDDASFKARR